MLTRKLDTHILKNAFQNQFFSFLNEFYTFSFYNVAKSFGNQIFRQICKRIYCIKISKIFVCLAELDLKDGDKETTSISVTKIL